MPAFQKSQCYLANSIRFQPPVLLRVMLLTLTLALLPLQSVASTFPEQAQPDLVVLQNGQPVGHVRTKEVKTDSHREIKVDYQVEQNARGAQLEATVTLNTAGYPVNWLIEGTSLMGGAVHEHFVQEQQQNQWQINWESQADSGSVRSDTPAVYITNDGTPWETGLYARLLLQSDNHTLDVLPAGSMQLTQLDTRTFSFNGKSVYTRLFKLSGINLSPSFILLDSNDNLFAIYGRLDSMTLQEGFEPLVDDLAEYFSDARLADINAMQQGLSHQPADTLFITNARVLDVRNGKLSSLSDIRIDNDTIISIKAAGETSIPESATVVDAEGGTLMPGLYDMHSHTSDTSGLYYIAAGVTGTLDMGNSPRWLTRHLEAQKEGSVIGPHIYRAGFVEGKSDYSAQTGMLASSLEEAIAAIDNYHELGYPMIKLYNSIYPEWVEPLVKAANERGMRVTGHVPAFVSPDEVIEWGYESIAHINQLVLGWLLEEGEDTRTTLRLTAMQRTHNLDLDSEAVQHTVELMKEHGTALDTTLIILERLMASRAGAVPPGDVDYLDHAPIGYQRYRKRTFVQLPDEETDKSYLNSVDALLDIAYMLHQNGIQLLPGTDTTTGFTLHREIELYTKAGIPNAEALYLGSLGAARYLGWDNVTGAVEPGMRADLVLVAGNPLDDIRAIKTPRLVLKSGVIHIPRDIYQALGFKPFNEPPPIHNL